VQSCHFIPYLWPAMDGRQGGLAVGGASGWSGHGLDQGGEKGEEIEGSSETCSPRAEKGSKVAGGGPQRRPTVVVRSGGALVAGSRRETAEEAWIGTAKLSALTTCSNGTPQPRFARRPAVLGSVPVSYRQRCACRIGWRRRASARRAGGSIAALWGAGLPLQLGAHAKYTGGGHGCRPGIVAAFGRDRPLRAWRLGQGGLGLMGCGSGPRARPGWEG
jgi:hypothetical protein